MSEVVDSLGTYAEEGFNAPLLAKQWLLDTIDSCGFFVFTPGFWSDENYEFLVSLEKAGEIVRFTEQDTGGHMNWNYTYKRAKWEE